MDSVDQAAKRKRTLSSDVLSEAASSLPNRILALSAKNSEMSKIDAFLRFKFCKAASSKYKVSNRLCDIKQLRSGLHALNHTEPAKC